MKANTPSPIVSVVIPTLNRRSTLPRAIDSVLNQTKPAHEVIVVDNGSTDGTMTMLESKYPTVIRLRETNPGVSAARNKGISSSTGSWIALLDSDDAWTPVKLEKQLVAINENTGYRITHTNEIWYRNGKHVNQKKKHEKRGGKIYENCLNLCCISPSSVLIKKNVFEDLGLFDENLPACEDYDMWLRITSREPVLYLDQPLTIKHGGHKDQLSTQHWGMDRFRTKSLEKILFEGQLSKDQETATHNILVGKLKILVNGAVKKKNRDVLQIYSEKLMFWEQFLLDKQLNEKVIS